MGNPSGQKAKLLYLMKILYEKSDEEHPLSLADMIAILETYGIHAERKSIYSDLEALRYFGLDIETVKRKRFGYYLASREFELPELKLLIDAVQTSRLITPKKSEKLIRKLAALAGEAQAKTLKRHVFIADRPKSLNETVYYGIDAIHAAINGKRQLRFRYFDYNAGKKRVYRRDGGHYIQTPVALCWNDDNYYLIAYSEKYDAVAHYRVDRMSDVEVMEEPGAPVTGNRFNVAEHARQVFGMYSGEVVRARLAFDESLVNAVLDRFGNDVILSVGSEGRFEIRVDIAANPVFLSWMFLLGDSAEILEPESLVDAMRGMIATQSKKYFP